METRVYRVKLSQRRRAIHVFAYFVISCSGSVIYDSLHNRRFQWLGAGMFLLGVGLAVANVLRLELGIGPREIVIRTLLRTRRIPVADVQSFITVRRVSRWRFWLETSNGDHILVPVLDLERRFGEARATALADELNASLDGVRIPA